MDADTRLIDTLSPSLDPQDVNAIFAALLAGEIEQDRGGAGEVPFTVRVQKGMAANGVFRPTTRPATMQAMRTSASGGSKGEQGGRIAGR